MGTREPTFTPQGSKYVSDVYMLNISSHFVSDISRVDAPITDHFTSYAPGLEKYKAMLNFSRT
jgi:hypothetical protein